MTHPRADTHPLEFMTDLWPRLFTDMLTVCRVRAVSRALSRVRLDFSATTMIICGDRVENGAEITVTNHRYCGEKCAKALTSGAAPQCRNTPVIRIVIFDNIIYVKCETLMHIPREYYPCAGISADRIVRNEDKKQQMAWPAMKIVRYDVTIGVSGDGVPRDNREYRSTAPGAALEHILGHFLDLTFEYF